MVDSNVRGANDGICDSHCCVRGRFHIRLGQCEVRCSVMSSRRSTRFSVRIIRWCVREILRRDGKATTLVIKAELAAKYRNCPTSNQLGQILSRSGYFTNLGKVNQRHTITNSKVHEWGLNWEKCSEFEWFQSEVDAVEVWNNVRGKEGFGGASVGGWDAPRRLGQGKGKPRSKRTKSDTEKENNSNE